MIFEDVSGNSYVGELLPFSSFSIFGPKLCKFLMLPYYVSNLCIVMLFISILFEFINIFVVYLINP